MGNKNTLFCSDWASPPGTTILDLLEERGHSKTELAQWLGFPSNYLNQLITGKAVLTEETALKLECVLGSTADFWLSREAKYRKNMERLKTKD